MLFACFFKLKKTTTILSQFSQYGIAGQEDLVNTIRVQSSQLAETNLFAEEESECLRRALCALGTTEDTTEWPKLSLGKGLQHLYHILKQMVDDVQAVDSYAQNNFPRLHQAVARYKL